MGVAKVFFALMVLGWMAAHDTSAQNKKPSQKSVRDSVNNSIFRWEKESRKNLIQWNFLSSFVLAANFSYERSLSRHAGLLAGGFVGRYTLTSRNDSLPFDTEIFGAGGYLECKIYPLGGEGRGFYLSPYSSFRFYKLKAPFITSPPGTPLTYGARKAESFNLAGGLTVGYRWILGNWFIINPYAGAGYNVSRFHFYGEAKLSDFNTRLIFAGPYEIRFGLNLGVALK